MNALRGILAGMLGLAALQALLSTDATKNLGSLTKWPGDVIRWFLDPKQPLIPDMRSDDARSIGAAIQAAYVNAGSMAGAAALGGAAGGLLGSAGSTGSGPTQGLGQLPVIPKKQQPKIVLPPATMQPKPGPLTI